jgi:hypothetical protein
LYEKFRSKKALKKTRNVKKNKFWQNSTKELCKSNKKRFKNSPKTSKFNNAHQKPYINPAEVHQK